MPVLTANSIQLASYFCFVHVGTFRLCLYTVCHVFYGLITGGRACNIAHNTYRKSQMTYDIYRLASQ